MSFGALPITIRQLQYFCAVAEELNFSRAAERCFVSQPSLSAQIAEMERVLDVRLFERDRRRVLVTPAGKRLLTHARRVLAAAADVIDAARLTGDPLSGVLRIGVIPTVGPYVLPDLDPALREAFPKLAPRWVEDKTEVLVHMVEQGDLDVALLAVEANIGHLDYAEIGRDAFVLAASPSHALGSSTEPVPTSVLRKNRVYVLQEGHCFGDQAGDVCDLTGADRHDFRATSLSTLAQMILSGDGVTVLPHVALEVENRRGNLVVRPFEEGGPYRTLALAWRGGSAWDEPLRRVADVARRVMQLSEI